MYTVLIVEDDEHLLRMYSRVFRHHGCDVVGVSDGKKVVDLVLQHKPDIILLDVMIPSFDGFSILLSLKEDALTKKFFVVMLTNLNDPKEQERSYQYGAALYLVKNDHEPLSLFSLIHNTVQKHYTKS